MTMLWYAPVCANCSANTPSFGLWARPPTASRRSPTPRPRNQMSFSWTWLCFGRTALRRHARFTTSCQTSTLWGFQRTVTKPPSVRCVKPEHTRTSARRKVHIACSITCSLCAHRQRRLRELDPSTWSNLQLLASHARRILGLRRLRHDLLLARISLWISADTGQLQDSNVVAGFSPRSLS